MQRRDEHRVKEKVQQEDQKRRYRRGIVEEKVALKQNVQQKEQ